MDFQYTMSTDQNISVCQYVINKFNSEINRIAEKIVNDIDCEPDLVCISTLFDITFMTCSDDICRKIKQSHELVFLRNALKHRDGVLQSLVLTSKKLCDVFGKNQKYDEIVSEVFKRDRIALEAKRIRAEQRRFAFISSCKLFIKEVQKHAPGFVL